ncbi:MAG: hypothetical protein M3Y79_01870 [Pseudomonadota bacterium]|nr:hypothetical protein [Pseudomonadota bacterium]
MNRFSKRIAAVAATVLLAACATTSPPAPPFRAGDTPGELVHNDSGFTFPARLGSFARFQGHQYDERGRDISVGYNGDIPSMVTVYVYPAGGIDLDAALTTQSASVLAAYPGARVTGRRTVQVTPDEIPAVAVSFEFSAAFNGREQPLHSELVLARCGDHFVKYRITYPETIADIAGEDSGKFLHYFAWP